MNGNRTVLWARRGLVVGLVLLLIGLRYPVFQQAIWSNVGLVLMHRGLRAGREEWISKGQSLLSRLDNDRYRSMAEGKLDPGNLLKNGSFEFHGFGWVRGGSSGWTRGKAHSGLQSLRIDFDGKDVNFYHVYQELPVQPGTCYRLEAYICAEGLTDGVGLDVWDAERGYRYWYGGQTPLIRDTVDWTPVALEFCTGSDVRRIQIRLRRYGGKGKGVSGTAWFDDIRLESLHHQEM